jgi:cytochrome bd-type quinol oxidase subunit 1
MTSRPGTMQLSASGFIGAQSCASQLQQACASLTITATHLIIPDVLSFLTYQRFHAQVKGLDAYPRDQWPDNVPLLYYAYHNMVGLGTFFIAILVFELFALWRGWLDQSRLLLWVEVAQRKARHQPDSAWARNGKLSSIR